MLPKSGASGSPFPHRYPVLGPRSKTSSILPKPGRCSRWSSLRKCCDKLMQLHLCASLAVRELSLAPSQPQARANTIQASLASLTFQDKRDRDSAAQDHALRTGRRRGLVRRSPCGHNPFSYRRICSQVTPRAPRSVLVARLRHVLLPIVCHNRTSRRLP